MLVRKTKAEMVAEWRLRKGMLAPVTAGAGNREDGLEVDSLIEREIDRWYFGLLETAPAEYLPLKDFAAEVEPTLNADGSVELELPEECRRVVEVSLSGWRRCAKIVNGIDSPAARMQSSPYIAGGSWQPVAVRNGRRLRLYSSSGATAQVERLICVAAPADGTYLFDESLLGTISTVAEQF